MAGTVWCATPAAVAVSGCARTKRSPGIPFDGGYAEYTVAPAEAVAAPPDDLPAAEPTPLLCAGITVLNAPRNAGVRSGELVAVQGTGGLGHLGIQDARQLGFRTVKVAESGPCRPDGRIVRPAREGRKGFSGSEFDLQID